MHESQWGEYTLAHSTLVPIFLTTTKGKPQTAVCGLQYIPKSLNIVKQKEHLTFNHALKRTEILPKSLRFNPPVNCKERFKITKKAGRSFLKLRIQSSQQRIKQLGEQCSNLVRKMSSIISQEHFDAPIANVVMEYIEERAISTAAHPLRWWYRYVDDSHACLKKDYVQEFHDYLNSVNLTYISSRRLSKASAW